MQALPAAVPPRRPRALILQLRKLSSPTLHQPLRWLLRHCEAIALCKPANSVAWCIQDVAQLLLVHADASVQAGMQVARATTPSARWLHRCCSSVKNGVQQHLRAGGVTGGTRLRRG